MPKVISIHEYVLKPMVEARQFEEAIRTAQARGLFHLPGLVAYHFVKGIKGNRQGHYTAILKNITLTFSLRPGIWLSSLIEQAMMGIMGNRACTPEYRPPCVGSIRKGGLVAQCHRADLEIGEHATSGRPQWF